MGRFTQMVMVLGLMSGLGACGHGEDVAPTPRSANYPTDNPTPQKSFVLRVPSPDLRGMRFAALYNSDARLCGTYRVEVGGNIPFRVEVPVAMSKGTVGYEGIFATDRFLPGKCGWSFSRVTYQIGGGPPNVLAVYPSGTEGVAFSTKQDFWCYHVTYQNKPLQDCETVALLKWSNAMRAVSPEFVNRFSDAEKAGTLIGLAQGIKEIVVSIHDLNEIPNALIPAGDSHAQAARAESERSQGADLPQAKAAQCLSDENFQWIMTHRPLPDTDTQKAAYEATRLRCNAKYGLQSLGSINEGGSVDRPPTTGTGASGHVSEDIQNARGMQCERDEVRRLQWFFRARPPEACRQAKVRELMHKCVIENGLTDSDATRPQPLPSECTDAIMSGTPASAAPRAVQQGVQAVTPRMGPISAPPVPPPHPTMYRCAGADGLKTFSDVPCTAH